MLKTRVEKIENKLNLNDKNVVVVYARSGTYLLKRDSNGYIGKFFTNFNEIKSLYENQDSIIITLNEFADLDEKAQDLICNNIKVTEISKNGNLNYNEFIDMVKEKALEIENL